LDKKSVVTCKCPACVTSEKAEKEVDLPYRFVAGKGQIVFHLSLIIFLTAIGTVLIGFSPWATVPVISLIVAYVANSYIFCATCSYHHENVRFCGCFPKSVFPYKRYKAWGHLDNIAGWMLFAGLVPVPTSFVLILKNDWNSVIIYLLSFILVILLQSNFSCPNCRQRSLCYLGKLTVLVRKQQEKKLPI